MRPLPVLLALALVPLLAGCADEPAPTAPVDDVAVPPAPVLEQVPVSFGGSFGYEGCLAVACLYLQNAEPYRHEMGNDSLSGINLTVTWDTLEPGAELRVRVECRMGGGRACGEARVLAEAQGPPPLQVSAQGLATPPGARVEVAVEAVRTLPSTLVNDVYEASGAFVVQKAAAPPEEEGEAAAADDEDADDEA